MDREWETEYHSPDLTEGLMTAVLALLYTYYVLWKALREDRSRLICFNAADAMILGNMHSHMYASTLPLEFTRIL